VAAGHSVEVDPHRWQPCLDELLGRIAGRFGRVEPRRRAKAFVCGLLADLPRKNCWTIAEHAGDASPDGMQHLLARAVWDHDGVRDDVRGYLVDQLGEPDAVLVVDETGDLKKGTTTVGIQRQYTGTAGRIENAQVAVSSSTRPRRGTPSSTGSCMCQGAGPAIGTAARTLASPSRSSLRPSRRWPPG
jgi:SRSO17 transposase